MLENNKMITARELANKLGLSVETIWKYTRENKIPFIPLANRQYRYNLDNVVSTLDNSFLKEEKSNYEVKSDKKYTYQDYLKLPEEPPYKLEVLEGMLVKEPSPNVMHQRVSRRLQQILINFFQEIDPEGEIFNAPLDVTFGEINVVQPDLLYISGEQKEIIKEKRIDGSPLLAVEIISPYSTRKDRVQKMHIYQKAQIQHYWLVDPAEKTFECFSLHNSAYTLKVSGMEDDIIEHPDFKGLSIKLKELWKT
jgi:Uma2 family endonuclease